MGQMTNTPVLFALGQVLAGKLMIVTYDGMLFDENAEREYPEGVNG